MAQYADTFDLETLHLHPGEGRRVDARVRLAPFELGGQPYSVESSGVEAQLDVSRTVSGYALRLRFDAQLEGACMRCMADASPIVPVDAREIEQPGEAEELHSPYVSGETVELARWAHDALVLALPTRILCREDCRGLCGVCGADLNAIEPGEHRHEDAGDPRWAKLRELKLR
jgi:uncharacterized protein